MPVIREILVTNRFEQNLKKLRDKDIKRKLAQHIERIRDNPEIGKPLRYGLKGERTIKVKPFRLIYSVEGDKLFLLRFMHRKKVYQRSD